MIDTLLTLQNTAKQLQLQPRHRSPTSASYLTKIYGDAPTLQLPTDMGVNRSDLLSLMMKSFCEASNQEIIRRYYAGQCDYKRGIGTLEAAQRKWALWKKVDFPQDRPVVKLFWIKRRSESSSSSLTTSNRNHYRKHRTP